MKRYWILNLVFAFLVAAEASACGGSQLYPALWRNPPLYSNEDEVVLKVEFAAYASPDRTGAPVVTSCDGGAQIFRVVQVVGGTFEEDEVTIVFPIVGVFFDAPLIGETRFIVGRPVGAVKLDNRYADNALQLKKQGIGRYTGEFYSGYIKTPVGGPSTVMEIRPRPPIEQRVIFFFRNLGPGGLVLLPLITVLTSIVLRIVGNHRKSTALKKHDDSQKADDRP